ncbi:unnamed protein product [Lampetra fluviatilis]
MVTELVKTLKRTLQAMQGGEKSPRANRIRLSLSLDEPPPAPPGAIRHPSGGATGAAGTRVPSDRALLCVCAQIDAEARRRRR